MSFTPSPVVREIGGACLAVRARMLARAVSSAYDNALADLGVTISQVNIMVAVGHFESCTPSRIGRLLAMERSTVSRNLRAMLERGWLAPESGQGGRLRSISLTNRGVRKLEALLPAWHRAQQQAASLVGDAGVSSLRQIGERLWARNSASDN